MKLKNLGITFISSLMIISLLLGGTAHALGDELPSPGITPDSPFYFFDILGKRLGLLFAFGAEAKIKKALEYAEERIAEAQTMAAQNKSKGVKRAARGYDRFMAVVTEKVDEARKAGISDNISETVALATSKHLSILERTSDTVPEEAKEVIAQAKETSIKGLGDALRTLVAKGPQRATEINLATIKGRLDRAKAKADENNIEAIKDTIDDAAKLFRFGEEISEIARGIGKDTTVEQLVARATSVHLEVLSIVYEKAPEQAKPAVERAMAASVRGHERAVEALKKKGALGEVPEKAPIPERVPGKVKERILTNRSALE